MKNKGGLGRGLGSLLGGASVSVAPDEMHDPSPREGRDMLRPAASSPVAERETLHGGDLAIRQVSPSLIVPNPHQPRRYFDPDELRSLAESIREHGVLQPLVVTELPGGKYELIAGERRLRASQNLGLPKIPVIVRSPVDDQKKLELALIENIQRHDLNPVEEAEAFQALIGEFSLRQEDVAERIGRSSSYVANTIRLLGLEPEIREAVADGRLSRSHARTLLAEPVPSRRKEMFEKMLRGEMTVREAEVSASSAKKRILIQRGKDPNIAALEAELREKLGTKVTLDLIGTTGKITVHFYSKEEMRSLVEKLVK